MSKRTDISGAKIDAFKAKRMAESNAQTIARLQQDVKRLRGIIEQSGVRSNQPPDAKHKN